MLAACGSCIGCQLDRAQDWTTRLVQELHFHADASFCTLTYSDEWLPANHSLSIRHMQLLIKRLRRAIAPKRISYFIAGEYGEKTQRPHYHAIIFGHDLRGPKVIGMSRNGEHKRYNSPALQALWSDPETRSPFGLVEVGSVTPASISYIAGYCVKKVGQALTPIVIDENGEFVPAEPEFILASRNPAIGLRYWQKYGRQAVNHDNVVIDGDIRPLPKYYSKKLAEDYPEEVIPIKTKRIQRSKVNAAHRTRARLAVREQVTNARISQRKKTL